MVESIYRGGFRRLQLARVIGLLGAALGLLGVAFPWWTRTWTLGGGEFRREIFLYADRIAGNLPGVGLQLEPVPLSSHDFALVSLGLVVLAAIIGIIASFTGRSSSRRLLILSSVLFSASLIVFLTGLGPVVSSEGGIFSLKVLSSSSKLTSGLGLGAYTVAGAVLLTVTSYLLAGTPKREK